MPAGALHVGFSLWLATLCDCTSLLPRSLRLTGAAVEAEPRPRAARPPPNRSALLAVEAGRLGPRRPGQLDSLYPRARHAACGAPRAADSGSRAGERCPAACPLYQEDLQGGGARGCVFRCVESSAQACAAANPGATVADPEWGICRSCWVEGCQRCAGDGTDRCAECAISFQLVGGRCVGRYGWVWKAAAAVAACLVLVLALWVANLRGRPVTNPYAVDKGLELRSRAKLRMPVDLARPQASASAICPPPPGGRPGRAASPPGQPQAAAEHRGGAEAGADVGERLPGEPAAEVPAAVDDSAGTPVEVQRSASAESYGFAAGSGELHADQPPGPPARGAAVTAEPSYGRLSYADSYGSPRWAPARSDSSGSGASGDAARRDPRSIMGKAEQCKDEFASTRRMWPLSTNLCKQDVAGPGVILSFNFQAGVMLWGLAVAVLWAAMAFLIDTDLLRMGTRSASTPRDQCIVMAWGFETQRRLMWAKVLFLAFVYALSSGGALLHSVRQLRAFQRIDEVETTHRDYAVKLSGIPAMDPSRFVEEELKDLLESATRKPAVGVSVCWCIKSQSQSDLLNGTIAFDLQEREEAVTGIKPDEGGDSPAAHQERTLVDRLFASIESAFVQEGFQRILRKGKSRQKGLHGQPRRRRELPPQGPRLPVHEDADYPVRDESAQSLGGVVVEELLGMSHSGEAWAVFNTQADRDEAVEAVASARGIEFEGSVITLEKAALDPDSILWENSGFLNSTSDLVMKLAVGGGVVMLSLAVWVVAFFGPYAYFVTNATYTYGQEPSNTEVFVFSGVVIAGNALMCLVCSEVSDWVGFHTTDAREVCNMLLYNLACVVQVVLDLAITYSISYLRLVGREIRTYDGTPLSELPTFVERIEAYPMQQELGREVYMFAWPATFLLPFLIEPLITVYVPFKLMEYIVRSHREITYTTAEAFLSAVPFDLSRYADINLNIMLAVLIFFFPGGYTLPLFLGLVGSHMFIYCYDHWRILRSSPSCYFSTMQVDWWVQWMLSIPCGLILAALVFKSRSGPAEAVWLPAPHGPREDGRRWGLQGYRQRLEGHLEDSQQFADAELFRQATVAFLIHVLVHTLLLLYVVPLFGRSDKTPSAQVPYETCSRRLASSFFSTNPVHCLRSRYIYGHSPPCDFRVRGKEHLLRPNPAIGCYFQDTWARGEYYTLGLTMGLQSARDALSPARWRWGASSSSGALDSARTS